MATKNKDIPEHDAPEGTTPKGEKSKGSSKVPCWSLTINRVDGAMWSHDQEDGTRYSVAITRSYFDKKSGQSKRGSYFDFTDLADLHAVATAAEEHIRKLRDEAQVAE